MSKYDRNIPYLCISWKRGTSRVNPFEKLGHQWVASKGMFPSWKYNCWQCGAGRVDGTICKVLFIKLTQEIQSIYDRCWKWMYLLFMTVLFPSLQVWSILFLCSRFPGLDDNIGSCSWKSLAFEMSPDKWQSSSLSVLFNGWISFGFDGSVSVSLYLGRRRGAAINIRTRNGHQAWVGQ